MLIVKSIRVYTIATLSNAIHCRLADPLKGLTDLRKFRNRMLTDDCGALVMQHVCGPMLSDN
jgi:hypothetical protein